MPRLINAVPKYRKHRASGQAVLTMSGWDYYLGPPGSKASRLEYDRLVQEWLANGRQCTTRIQPGMVNHTTAELCFAFLRHAEKHYVKHGRQTNELIAMKTCLRCLKEFYENTEVVDYRQLCLDVAPRWSSDRRDVALPQARFS